MLSQSESSHTLPNLFCLRCQRERLLPDNTIGALQPLSPIFADVVQDFRGQHPFVAAPIIAVPAFTSGFTFGTNDQFLNQLVGVASPLVLPKSIHSSSLNSVQSSSRPLLTHWENIASVFLDKRPHFISTQIFGHYLFYLLIVD